MFERKPDDRGLRSREVNHETYYSAQHFYEHLGALFLLIM